MQDLVPQSVTAVIPPATCPRSCSRLTNVSRLSASFFVRFFIVYLLVKSRELLLPVKHSLFEKCYVMQDCRPGEPGSALGLLPRGDGRAAGLDHLHDLRGRHPAGVGFDFQEVDADAGIGGEDLDEILVLGAAGEAPGRPVVDDGVVGFGQGGHGLAVGRQDEVELVDQEAREICRGAAGEGTGQEGREGRGVVAETLEDAPALLVVDPELGHGEVVGLPFVGDDDLDQLRIDELGIGGPHRRGGGRVGRGGPGHGLQGDLSHCGGGDGDGEGQSGRAPEPGRSTGYAESLGSHPRGLSFQCPGRRNAKSGGKHSRLRQGATPPCYNPPLSREGRTGEDSLF